MNLTEQSKKLNNIEFHFPINNMEIRVLWFRIMNRNKQWRIQRHLHSTFEIHIVQSGDSKVILDNQTFIVKKGDCYITPPGNYHEQINGNEDTYTEYSMNVDLELINNSYSEEYELLNILSNTEVRVLHNSHELISLFEGSLNEAGNGYSGYNRIIINNITNMLIILSRRLSNYKLARMGIQKNTSTGHFSKMHSYIKDNVIKRISVKEVASYVFLSEKQASRVVQQSLGTSLKSLIDVKRNEKACEIIRNTSLQMKEISEYMDFTSPFVFSKFFKRMNDMTPLEYRIMSKNDNL
ncbi:Arabinose operon regulatory protein [Candidatus Izimaplasma bacterium HR1]|jgi:AraC-like DNA-binding protein/mannose-6-phosphate isomerase-like protein (cupin superfamily)|uniref:AraC family transcriptional regulator n=1 Tax=Candidatus Izimoplasma sp. HR1 TaxID=1541959 RepID=UPI0004F5E055|nr:Arabinose operon regulatory protein [Candidatus Izimaplasma bacterium HR1]